VRFDTDHLLRMDPDTRNGMLLSQLGKSRAPSEIRAADNLPPFTPEQIQEMKDLGIVPTPTEPALSVGSIPPDEGALI
jgi:hypothetical protein